MAASASVYEEEMEEEEEEVQMKQHLLLFLALSDELMLSFRWNLEKRRNQVRARVLSQTRIRRGTHQGDKTHMFTLYIVHC